MLGAHIGQRPPRNGLARSTRHHFRYLKLYLMPTISHNELWFQCRRLYHRLSARIPNPGAVC